MGAVAVGTIFYEKCCCSGYFNAVASLSCKGSCEYCCLKLNAVPSEVLCFNAGLGAAAAAAMSAMAVRALSAENVASNTVGAV